MTETTPGALHALGLMPELEGLDFAAQLAKARDLGLAHAAPAPHLLRAGAAGDPWDFDIKRILPPGAIIHIGIAAYRPMGIDDVVAQAQAHVDALRAQQPRLLAAAQESGDSADEFRRKMEEQRTQAKAEMNKTIDDSYAKLEEIGKREPESQPLIVQAMFEISSLVSNAVSAIDQTFNATFGIFGMIAGGFVSVAETVGNGIVHVAEEIGHGIKKIFSGW